MTKKELVKKASLSTGIEEKECSAVLEAMLMVSKDALIQGKRITLRGFGTFNVITRKAKIGQNISKGISIEIPEKKTVKFVVSKLLKSRL